MALLAAAALVVSTFGYIASTSQRTSVTLGAGRWWIRVRPQEPLATKGAPPAAPTTVTINGDVLLGQTSPVSFTCVDLDWWPETKCDYGRCTWGRSSLLTIDLEDRRLRAALRTLSPSFLRLGGSLSDFVRYEVSDTDAAEPVGCNASFGGPTLATRLGFPVGGGCLKASRWDDLHQLCRDTGCSIVFTLNALAGRYLQDPCAEGTDCLHHAANHTCCTSWGGAWDPTNAAQLLRHARRSGNVPWGLALGNELVGAREGKWGVDAGGIQAHLSARQYAADFCRLSSLVSEVWPEAQAFDGPRRPRLVAPDGHFMSQWYAEFLQRAREAGCTPDVVSYHQYLLGAGVDPQVGRKALEPSWLDRQKAHAATVASVVRESTVEPRPELWMSEAGGAYNSGAAGVTDAFHSSFWFLDGLGVLAQRGHHTFCRQTLAGGSYGLLNTSSLAPNPDLYALLLWRQLMGERVLGARAAASSASGSGAELAHLRAYAHCTRSHGGRGHAAGGVEPGDVTLLLINLHPSKSYQVKLNTPQPLSSVDVYVVSSDSISSQAAALNGEWLRTAPDGSLPQLIPRRATSRGERLVVAPHTYGFFVLRGAGAAACGPSVDARAAPARTPPARAAAPVPVHGAVHPSSTSLPPPAEVAPLVDGGTSRGTSPVDGGTSRGTSSPGGGSAAGGAAGGARVPLRRYTKHKDGRELWGRKQGVGQRLSGGGGGFAALRRLVRDAPAAAAGAVPVDAEDDDERRRRRREAGLANIWSMSEH